MKKIITIITVSLSLLLMISVILAHVYPKDTLILTQELLAKSLGFKKKSVTVDGYLSHYYEAGDKDAPVLLLLHGLMDEKFTFVQSSGKLTDSYRVILPDLLAHGENEMLDGENYSISDQVEFIFKFLSELEIEQLVVGGNSMGGHVATAFAISYPKKASSLIILNATGIQLDKPPTYFMFPDVIDLEYVEAMYDDLFVNEPFTPKVFKIAIGQNMTERVDFVNKMVNQIINGDDFRLDEKVSSLKIPVLIIWGDKDNTVPIEYGKAYHERIKGSEFVTYEAGHAPQLEMPNRVAKDVMDFLLGNNSIRP